VQAATAVAAASGLSVSRTNNDDDDRFDGGGRVTSSSNGSLQEVNLGELGERRKSSLKKGGSNIKSKDGGLTSPLRGSWGSTGRSHERDDISSTLSLDMLPAAGGTVSGSDMSPQQFTLIVEDSIKRLMNVYKELTRMLAVMQAQLKVVRYRGLKEAHPPRTRVCAMHVHEAPPFTCYLCSNSLGVGKSEECVRACV
jgi:hypothetical protein